MINSCHTRLANTCASNGKRSHQFIKSHDWGPKIRTWSGSAVFWLYCYIYLRIHIHYLLVKIPHWHYTGLVDCPSHCLNITVTKSSDAEIRYFIDLRLKKRLSKQSRRRCFATLSRSLCSLCNDIYVFSDGQISQCCLPLHKFSNVFWKWFKSQAKIRNISLSFHRKFASILSDSSIIVGSSDVSCIGILLSLCVW